MNKPDKKSPQRPDQNLFRIMMGAFFLILAIAPAYWAFYNYGEYNHTKNFVQGLNSKSDQFLTPDEKKEKESRVFFLEASADRKKLEMILSGVGAVVLFGISALLFVKAFKSRGKKNFYEEINTQIVPIPSAKIEVKYTNFQNFLLGGVIVFFVLMSALISYQMLTSPFSTSREIIVKGGFLLLVLALIFVFIFLTIRAKRFSVRFLDASGVTRGDGRHFAWTAFCGVITQTARRRFGGLYVWRKELAFADGQTAWLIPNRIKNSQEVFDYIAQLPPAVPKSQ